MLSKLHTAGRPSSGGMPRPSRVLVVDDTDAQRYAVASAIRLEGFEVLQAATGEEALALASREILDAVVLDVHLPDLDGFDVCRRLKADSSRFLPVLLLSATATSECARTQGKDAGADGYLTHPISATDLRAWVCALVRVTREIEQRVADASLNALTRNALDTLGDHIALLGPTGEVLVVNRAWTAFATERGCGETECGVGMNYLDVCDRAASDGEEDARAIALGLREVLAGVVSAFEYDYTCHAPTEERWYRMVARRTEDPGPVAVVVSHSNQTRIQRASRTVADAHAKLEAAHVARHDMEARFHRFVESAHEGVLATGLDGIISYSNQRTCELIQCPTKDLVGTSIFALVQEGRATDFRAQYALLAEGRALTIDVELAGASGEVIDVLASLSPILTAHGDVGGALVMLVDQRAQKSAERKLTDALRVAEVDRLRLHATLEALPVGVWIAEPDGRVTHSNPAAERIWRGALPILDRPADYGAYRAWWPETGLPIQPEEWHLARTLATGETFTGEMIEIARFDGSRGWSLNSTAPIRDQHGQIIGGVVALLDVTERELAAAAVREARARLRDQFAKLPVPTFLWEAHGDDDFILMDCNEAAAEADPELSSAIGCSARAFYPGYGEIRAEMYRSLRQNVVIRLSLEANVDGSPGPRHFELTIGPQQPNRILLHAVDITDRHTLETQLRQAQKMEAVGQLAGGVAHDFNNLLTVIGAHSTFLLESLESSDPQREDAEAIHTATVRAAGLTRQLLAFSRKQILRPSVLDVNGRVTDIHSMLSRLLGEDIDIVTDLAPDLPRVVADAGQLGQVLVNLAVNARDAMPTGGYLSIRTYVEDLETAHGLIAPGRYVVLSVRDTGTGMDATVRARLFEPFFTTKGPGEGTGLGLATVYGIVKQSGGYVTVESALGAGSTFFVHLPAVASDDQADQLEEAVRAVARGVETVLLVEDEAGVRAVAQRALRRQGYVVLEAENGIMALAVSAGYQAPIHLLLTDAVMPGMGGADVIERIQAARPEIRVLVMSGYTDDEMVRRGIVASNIPFIEKPFDSNSLAKAVRNALDAT